MTVPIGTIMAYGGPVSGNAGGKLADQGWLVCNGAEKVRDDYPELYRVIGDAFGRGDGVHTFNLPDLEGRFVRGVDHGTGRDPDAKARQASDKGGNEGNSVGSVQEDAFQKHSHFALGRADWKGGGKEGDDRTVRDYGGADVPVEEKEPHHFGEHGYNETRPKNIYVNWIIKAKCES